MSTIEIAKWMLKYNLLREGVFSLKLNNCLCECTHVFIINRSGWNAYDDTVWMNDLSLSTENPRFSLPAYMFSVNIPEFKLELEYESKFWGIHYVRPGHKPVQKTIEAG